MKKLFVILLIFVASDITAQPDTLWSRSYGTDPGIHCYDAIRSLDNGFLIVGSRQSLEFRNDFYAIKADSNGFMEWTSTLNAPWTDDCLAVCQIPDGYLLAGGTVLHQGGQLNCRISKISNNGDSLWAREFGGESSEFCSLVNNMTGSIVSSGKSSAYGRFGGSDAYMVKIDEDGEEIWHNVFGGESYENIYDMIATSDGGYILGGESGSFGRGSQIFVVKTDSAGNEDWTYVYGDSLFYACVALTETFDNGYGLLGMTIYWDEDMHREIGYVVIRLDSEGNVIWIRNYSDEYPAKVHDILAIDDGGFVIGGENSDLSTSSLFRVDAEGEPIWNTGFSTKRRDDDACQKLFHAENGGYYMIGNRTDSKIFMLQTTPDPVTVPYLLDPVYPTEIVLHSPYPNPFNSTTTITWSLPRPERVTVTIFDQLGRRVSTLLDQRQSPGSHSIGWQSEGLSAGVYFCRVVAGGRAEVREVVMVR